MAKKAAPKAASPAHVEAGMDRITFEARRGKPAQRMGRILVALDGSEASEAALSWAIGIAKATKAKLDIVSVGPPGSVRKQLATAAPGWSAARAAFEEFEERAAEVLKDAAAAAKQAGVVCATGLLEGSPAPTIVATAKALEVDLVVLGSHGHGALERALRMGSVAEAVKHRAHCSILLVRSAWPPRHAVLGTDGSTPSRTAVLSGLDLLQRLGATSTIVHAFDALYGYAHAPPGSSLDQLARIVEADQDASPGTPYRFRLRVGGAAATLLRLADQEKAGLIVVGARGRGGLRSALLGSVSDDVTRHAKQSVLVVRS